VVVAGICTRVVAAAEAGRDPFAHLVRIGIDEIHIGGPTYLVVVVDHDSGHLIWAAPGRDSQTLVGFFDALGAARCRAAAAGQPRRGLLDRHGGRRALPPGHPVHGSVSWWSAVPRTPWTRCGGSVEHTARRAGADETAHALKGARWALWHNPENLTDQQQLTLETIARTNRPLYRAYLLKEGLRLVFQVGRRRALEELGQPWPWPWPW
jgi:transposase